VKGDEEEKDKLKYKMMMIELWIYIINNIMSNDNCDGFNTIQTNPDLMKAQFSPITIMSNEMNDTDICVVPP